nr:MAG TPA: hypothetical protein [Caudoviricetes sp.]
MRTAIDAELMTIAKRCEAKLKDVGYDVILAILYLRTNGIITDLGGLATQRVIDAITRELSRQQQKVENLEWVATEYIPLFRRVNPKIVVEKKECMERMAWFMKQNPSVDRETILEATRAYISNTNPKFLMRPYYFIRKKRDGVWSCELKGWTDIIQAHSKCNKGKLQ